MKTILTPEQSRAARRSLGLTQNQVVEKSRLSGYKLKQFESGFADPGGVTSFLRELRKFYESEGYKFTDEPTSQAAPTAAHPATPSIDTLSPQLGVGIQPVRYFPISSTIPDEVVRDAMYLMEENDARLVLLLQNKLERNSSLFGFGEGELTEESRAVLQEVFALLAGNYITFRMLRGWPALNVKPTTDKPETVRDMVMQTFMQPLIDAGLIAAPEEIEEVDAEKEEAAE